MGKTLQRIVVEEKLPAPPDAEPEAESEEDGLIKRTMFRLRLEGLPLLFNQKKLEEVVDFVLRKFRAAPPERIEVVVNPISQRPQGYAYMDFANECEAVELAQHRECRLGEVRLRIVNEGLREEI